MKTTEAKRPTALLRIDERGNKEGKHWSGRRSLLEEGKVLKEVLNG
jgi:hypothetical protein